MNQKGVSSQVHTGEITSMKGQYIKETRILKCIPVTTTTDAIQYSAKNSSSEVRKPGFES